MSDMHTLYYSCKSGCSSDGTSAWFGTRRPSVRDRSPRLVIHSVDAVNQDTSVNNIIGKIFIRFKSLNTPSIVGVTYSWFDILNNECLTTVINISVIDSCEVFYRIGETSICIYDKLQIVIYTAILSGMS